VRVIDGGQLNGRMIHTHFSHETAMPQMPQDLPWFTQLIAQHSMNVPIIISRKSRIGMTTAPCATLKIIFP